MELIKKASTVSGFVGFSASLLDDGAGAGSASPTTNISIATSVAWS